MKSEKENNNIEENDEIVSNSKEKSSTAKSKSGRRSSATPKTSAKSSSKNKNQANKESKNDAENGSNSLTSSSGAQVKKESNDVKRDDRKLSPELLEKIGDADASDSPSGNNSGEVSNKNNSRRASIIDGTNNLSKLLAAEGWKRLDDKHVVCGRIVYPTSSAVFKTRCARLRLEARLEKVSREEVLYSLPIFEARHNYVHLRYALLTDDKSFIIYSPSSSIKITRNDLTTIENNELPCLFIDSPENHLLNHAFTELKLKGDAVLDLKCLYDCYDIHGLSIEVFYSMLVSWFLFKDCFPILFIVGNPGSGKSTLASLLSLVVSPLGDEIFSDTLDLNNYLLAPAAGRDLYIITEYLKLLVFDNISSLSPKILDDICRISTGGSTASRMIYTDSGLSRKGKTRPLVFTTTNPLVADRSDVLSRSFFIHLYGEKGSNQHLWKDTLLPAVINTIAKVLFYIQQYLKSL